LYDRESGETFRQVSVTHYLKACVTDIIFASKEVLCNISPKVRHGLVLNSRLAEFDVYALFF
jgi:hypothetical protein